MKKVIGIWLCMALLFCMVPMVHAESTNQTPKYLPYYDVGELSEGLAWYSEYNESDDSELYGFINLEGKVVIEAKYEYVSNFKDGLSAVMLDGKSGFIDKTGKVVVDLQYDDVADEFTDGLAYVVKDELYGFIDKSGKEVITPQYEDAFPYTEGLAPVSKNDVYGYIDTKGNTVIPFEYYYALNFSNGIAPVYDYENDLYGFIDTKGKLVINYKYDDILLSSEGLTAVYTKGKWGFMDKAGKEVIKPQYDEVGKFSEGLAAVMINNKWGFIDKTGKVIIKPTYLGTSFFKEGLALAMKSNGKSNLFGYIDKTGKEVTKFEANFYGYSFNDGYALAYDLSKESYYFLKNPLTVPAASASAKPTASKVLVNGKLVSFEAYNINGSNYFKLRDLAVAVNGTDKNFEVSFDGTKNAINLLPKQTYTKVGGELAPATSTGVKTAKLTNSKIYVDGKEAQLTAYNIGGNNYFKLRDIAKVFDIGVTYDGTTSTIGIDTSISYTE